MKESVIQTFFDLVQIDSPSGEEENVLGFIDTYLSACGITHSRDTYGNLIAKIVGDGAPLILTAHCDTVNPGKGIKPVLLDGIISSKGDTILGADNKVGLAAILDAVAYCKKNNLPTKTLELVFTKSEEVANLGATNLDYSHLMAKEGYCFDKASPVGTIVSAAPFYNRFDITLKGKASHGSRPEDGINVLEIFADGYALVKKGKVSSKTIVNIGYIQAGAVRNSIPEKMILQGEVRSFSEKELEQYTQAVFAVFKKSAHSRGGSAELEKARENGGYEYEDDNVLLLRTKKVFETLDIKPLVVQTWGISDANVFHENGISVMELGDGSQDTHTINESISVENLIKLRDVIIALITTNDNLKNERLRLLRKA